MKPNDETYKNMDHIQRALKPELDKLGLVSELTCKNQHNENSDWRLKITYPALPDFLAEILGREWNKENRASLWIKTYRSVHKQAHRSYSDGSPNFFEEKYEYHRSLTQDEMKAFSFDYMYSHSPLYALQVSFKATKNPKLICNDVIPAITTYLEVVKLVSPRIDKEIEGDNKVLIDQNEVDALCRMICGYPLAPNDKPSRHDYKIEGLGKVSYDEYGHFTLEKEVSKDDLMKELNRIHSKQS